MTHAYKRLIHEGEPHYGRHLIIDAAGCNERMREIHAVADFVRSLVVRIGMRAWGPCICERFGEGAEVGISCVQLIETSSITVHTNDAAGDLYLDVFSCKDFDPEMVIDHLRAAFSPKDVLYRDVFRK